MVIGGGSAAFAATLRASALHAQVTMINGGLPMGGCCVNVGCVPSKALIRAAEAHVRPGLNRFAGIRGESRLVDFAAVIEQEQALVAALREEKYARPLRAVDGVRYVRGLARLVGPTEVRVNDEVLRADRIIVATGSRPTIPPIPGLDRCRYYTNENLFDLASLPSSVIVLGGGYIALECATMLARFGARVTLLQRSDRILSKESPLVSQAAAKYLAEDDRIEIVTEVRVKSCAPAAGTAVAVEADVGPHARTFAAEALVVAVGRTANAELLGDVVRRDPSGNVEVNEFLQTSAPTIFAAGDVIGPPLYVYAAAYEGALAAENAIAGEPTARDYSALPWVIFTDPQVCGVGADERQATELGIQVDAVTLPLSAVPRCVVARDTRGFVHLVRDRRSDRLVGARIVAPEGSELLGELTLAIKTGSTIRQLAQMFHAYLTLGEAVKLAALAFSTDIHKLSCCATSL